jgi:hypothetical protein
MVPVPYSITAKQGDDANTASTVRFTKKRAHNMGSLITKCSGDQPGTGTGIKSGTTGAACHPKTHSGNVRIKGKWAIRHNDTWEMNNRNTLGKLTYIKSTETFAETPAILLTQNPQDQAPAEPEVSDTVAAIMRGMERAREEGLPEGSYQVAQALEVMPDVPQRPGAPNATPGTRIPQPTGPVANDNMRPTNNRIARSPAGSVSAAAATRVLGLLGLAEMGYAVGDMAGQWYVGPEGVMARRIGEVVGAGQVNPWSRQGVAIGRALGPPGFGPNAQTEYANGLLSLKAGKAVDFRALQPEELEELVQAPWPDAETIASNAEAVEQDKQQQAARAQVTAGNVRIEGEEEDRDPCEVKRYGGLTCPEGEQAHHIVPDSLLRYGNRSEGEAGLKRIDGMPSFRDGMAVCLTGQASDPTSGHGIAHSVTDPLIAAAGAAAPIPGTTTVATGVAAGIAGASAAKPECVVQITVGATTQFSAIGQGRLLNAANRPARGAALQALSKGQ